MSSENTTNKTPPSVPSIRLEIPYQKPRTQNFQRKQTRSTYTEANAETFRPIFDELIASNYKLEKAIPWGTLGLTAQTLYIKIADGLKWLCDREAMELRNNPAACIKYNLLKNSYKICREQLGVTFRVKKSLIPNITSVDLGVDGILKAKIKSMQIVTVDGEQVARELPEGEDACVDITPAPMPKKIEDLVLDFIANGQSGTVQEISCNVITDEDKQKLEQIFANTQGTADYLIEGNVIKVMKV